MTDPATSLLVALGIEPYAFVAALGLALAATALVAVLHDALQAR
jgi:hypothetical protein